MEGPWKSKWPHLTPQPHLAPDWDHEKSAFPTEEDPVDEYKNLLVVAAETEEEAVAVDVEVAVEAEMDPNLPLRISIKKWIHTCNHVEKRMNKHTLL